MAKLTQYQQNALLVLRTRLNPHDPDNTAHDEVKAHLRAIDSWLSTWVLTAVAAMDSENGCEHRWLREAMAQEAGYIRRSQAQRKKDADK